MKGVQQGYYDTNDEKFVSRTTEWGDYGVPKELQSDENEDDGYCEIYRTTDGKLFLDEKAAKAHEETIVAPEVDQVKELLEKAKILALASKDKYPVLDAVADAIGSTLSDPDELMEKYYDSTC